MTPRMSKSNCSNWLISFKFFNKILNLKNRIRIKYWFNFIFLIFSPIFKNLNSFIVCNFFRFLYYIFSFLEAFINSKFKIIMHLANLLFFQCLIKKLFTSMIINYNFVIIMLKVLIKLVWSWLMIWNIMRYLCYYTWTIANSHTVIIIIIWS